MDIKVLGSGCRNCENLEEVTRKAVEKLGLDAEITHVREFDEIMAYGVMQTPALVVDGKVVFAGRVPKVDDLAKKLATLAG